MVKIFIIFMKINFGLLRRTAPTSVLKTGGWVKPLGGGTSATRIWVFKSVGIDTRLESGVCQQWHGGRDLRDPYLYFKQN